MENYELELLRNQLIEIIDIIDYLLTNPGLKTTVEIVDIKAKPQHVNSKGIQVDGIIMISVVIRYGKKFEFKKAFGFLPKDLKEFTLDEFKARLYRESRVWIKEAELQDQALKKLHAAKSEVIYLD